MTSTASRSFKTVAAGLAATAALSLAACGGSSGSGAAASGPLDRDALAQRLTTICTDAAEQVKDIKTPTSPDGLDGYIDQTVPLAEDLVTKIDALQPAPDAKADFDELLAAEKASLAALKGAQSKGVAGLASVADQAPKAAAAAKRLGVTCA